MNRLHPNWGTAFILAAVIAAFLFAQHVDNGPTDMDAEAATAVSLRDALAQAQRERPDLWTPETRARADAAAGIVARTVRQ